MKKRILETESNHLGIKTHTAVYGHFGYAIMLFPSNTDSYEECEETGLIDGIKNFIKSGRCKVYAITGYDKQSWQNPKISDKAKSEAHIRFNNYVSEEMVRLIYSDCGGAVPIITCGVGKGGYHAANEYFRRPDIFLGTISISAFYNIERLSGTIFDLNCYYNSPQHYLPNLDDNYWLSFLKNRHHAYLACGSGEGEDPNELQILKHITSKKNLGCTIDIWDERYGADWPSRSEILAHYIGTKL